MTETLEAILTQVERDRADLFETLRTEPSGFAWCQAHTHCVDHVWRALYQETIDRYPGLPPFSIVATGGYGRNELSPHSDIDVALVPLHESDTLNEAIRWLFRIAHDVFDGRLGFKVSYVYRLLADVPGLDAVSLSNMLDARGVAGPSAPYQRMVDSVDANLPIGEFLWAKIDERRREWEKSHTTPLVVEPNIKFGAGGLRDIHAAGWISQVVGIPDNPPSSEADLLLTVRNLLHFHTERHHDHLTRARREQVAQTLSIDAYELGSKLAEAMESVHRRYKLTLEELRHSKYRLASSAMADQGRLIIDPDATVSNAARAVQVATRLGLDTSQRLDGLQGDARPEVLPTLAGGPKTLANLDSSGLLARILPELDACRWLMPTDGSHIYTVFQHTMQAVANLDSISSDDMLGAIKAQVEDYPALVLAVLLHDVGKQDIDRPHSESGEERARQVCARLGLDGRRTELIAWLVREHLSMSRVIRMRDVMHSETAQEFAEIVGDEQRLHMLCLLTWCDVNAVNERLWTPVQETFLLELHARTLHLIRQEAGETLSAPQARMRVRRRLMKEAVPEEELSSFLESLPAHYLLATDPETTRDHYLLSRKAIEGEGVVSFKDFRELGVTDFTVCCQDRKGLLSNILGVLYAHDISMIGLRAATTTGDPPLLLDTFTIAQSSRCLSDRTKATVEQAVLSVIRGQTTADELLRQKGKDPERLQEVMQLNVVDHDPLIVEVRAPHGRGLAYRISKMVGDRGLNILAARLGQWAGSGSAALYVRPSNGERLDATTLERSLLGQ